VPEESSIVAVVGLGAMGRRIAARLVGAGLRVIVWNRTSERAAELAADGVTAAVSPAEAARDADFVLTMISDPDALRAVTEGPDGVAAAIGPAAMAVEMSTVGPGAIHRLRSALPAETALVDAPVLGSTAEAENGALSIFVGGEARDVARVESVLAILGEPIHVGPLGSGAAAKLVANSTMFATVAALGETIALADGLGLERETTFSVLERTPLGPQAARRRESFERGEYPTRFSLALARKDAELVTRAAAEAGVDLRLAAAAASWLADAEAAGLGPDDYSAVLAHITERARAPRDRGAPDPA
jgi:3-hydroxyisobutyrate dehydrogenase-like beta-hydroxyacid dehydrogenase